VAARVPSPLTDIALTAHVTVLTGAANGKYPDGNSVVVAGREGALVIDPSLTVHARGGLPVPVDRVLLSHAHEDHMSGVSVLGEVTVHAHAADLPGVRSLDGLMDVYGLYAEEDEEAWRAEVVEAFHYVCWPEAHGFIDGDTFDLGGVTVRAVHLAGHTRGHSGFVVEPDGVAFVGDIDLSGFGPYYGDHWSDLGEFVSSLERVADIDAAHYVTFHHKGVVHGRAEFLRQLAPFAAVIERRDDALLALLDRPRTLDELAAIGIVYRAGARPAMFGSSVERRTIEMHLDRLLARGALSRSGERYLAAP
jgi:glyoxylase-like metal-dependent hydrolase (beta-lactamase superfamily II)